MHCQHECRMEAGSDTSIVAPSITCAYLVVTHAFLCALLLHAENMAALSSQVEENPSQETTTAHACMLPWGEAQAGQRVLDLLGSQPPDVILMAECVYGSDPSVWAKLVATLQQLAAPHTLILQVCHG
jgi:hypothetical protein